MLDLTALTQEVNDTVGEEASAVVVINALAAAVEANKADPVALQALVDQLKAGRDPLAAAIAANPAA